VMMADGLRFGDFVWVENDCHDLGCRNIHRTH
jgi:hypothetical protein